MVLHDTKTNIIFSMLQAFLQPTDLIPLDLIYILEVKTGRNLIDCTVKTHSTDLETVIKSFDNKYKEIYLVGHSLG